MSDVETNRHALLGEEFRIVGDDYYVGEEMPHRLLARGPVADGLSRVFDASREWLPAVVAAVATWQLTEAFAAFLVLYLPLAIWDYVLGSRGREWDSTAARNGLASKALIITVACVLHGVGFLAQRYGIPGIPAPIGVFFVVGLIVAEARSVNKHHKRLTGKEIAGLGTALGVAQAAQERILYGEDGPPGNRRRRRREPVPPDHRE